MARRLVHAALLALAGLGLLVFASPVPGLFGMPYRHVPARATITAREAGEARSGDQLVPISSLRYRYAFEGRDYEGSYTAPDRKLLMDRNRHVGDLRVGDALDIWFDPERPQFEAPWPDARLGREPAQVLFGAALVAAGIVTAIAALARRQR